MDLKLASRFFWPKNSTSVRFNFSNLRVRLGLALARARTGMLWPLAPQHAIADLAQRMLTPPAHHFPDGELRLMEEASLLRVPLVTGALIGWRWGRAGDPVVVLVHGWGGRGTQLRHFIAPLLERGYSVVAYDAPGHGMTGGRESSLPHFLHALEVMLDRLGPAHALIGHSLGAATIATLLAKRPDINSRAVLIAPPASLKDSTLRVAALMGWPEPLRAAVQRRIEYRFGIPWSEFEVGTRSGSQGLLVIHDREDREVPFAEGLRYVEAWPRARMLETSGIGHRRILADDAAVAAAVEFVAASRP